jgi:flavodoxin
MERCLEKVKVEVPERGKTEYLMSLIKELSMKCARALALIAMAICLVACSNAQQRRTDAKTSQLERKILIVYLSRTSNTKAVAEFIHEEIGGTLVAIELERPYPEDYRATVDQVARENETGYLPPLKTKIERIEQYEFVFIGFPTWGMQLPPPMKSFLKEYNLKGKTVVLFNTNAGYGVGSGFAAVRELCPGSTVLEGFTTTGGIERDGIYLAIKDERAREVRSQVRDWLKRIKVLS